MPTSLTSHALARALEYIATKVSGEISVTSVLTFLFIAERGRCTQKDVEIALGCSNAATSRNVSFWTDRHYNRQDGMDFVARVEGDHDRRYKELTLTTAGKRFYRALLEAPNKRQDGVERALEV